MDFKDIKPYIQCSNYSINVSLKYLNTQIETFQEDLNLELNPDFQRGYVWTEEQQVKFMEHLLKGGRSGLDIYFNHTKWDVWTEVDMGWFVCVDGLQRITACMKFLNNEIKVFNHLYKEFTGKLHPMIGLKFHINNLKTRAEVLEWYIQMNSGGTVHSNEEIDRVKALLESEKNK